MIEQVVKLTSIMLEIQRIKYVSDESALLTTPSRSCTYSIWDVLKFLKPSKLAQPICNYTTS